MDLAIGVQGIIHNPLGLIDFMIMGDLVLLEKEINPVISALAGANINVTGLHNHFIGEEPRIMYMHVGGMGRPEAMAKGLRNALDKTATPRAPSSGTPPALALDTKRLEQIIGHQERRWAAYTRSRSAVLE